MAQPKTEGYEWLHLSLMAFNGSGYADMTSAEDYLDSYIAYKTMRKKKEAVALAKTYHAEALVDIRLLLSKTLGAGRRPAEAYVKKHQAFRKQLQDQTGLF